MSDKRTEAQRRLKERQAKKRFKLPEGETTFRVLPNARGMEEPEFFEYAMHSQIGPRKAYMRCGKKSNGKGTCFLCDNILPKLESSEKPGHQTAAKDMARKDVFAVQIAYQDNDQWLGPVVWEMSNTIANSMLAIFGSKKRDVADPKRGYNLTISRTGTGMRDTKYGSIDRDEDSTEVDEDILAKLKPFSEIIRKYDEAAMKAAYYGHEQEEEDTPVVEDDDEDKKVADDDEEEVAKLKKKKVVEDEEEEEKPKKKKKPVDEDDDTEAEEKPLDDDEAEDEDEKPAKKKKKPADEDEDEDEDSDVPGLEDDDEEEAKPSKKKKKPVDEDDDTEDTEDEEEEDAKPKKKGKKQEDDEEDEKPKKKKRVVEEEDDE